MERLKFAVTGMSCGHCVRALTEVITETPGASEPEVDLAGSRAEFDFSGDAGGLQDLLARAAEEGYTLTPAH